MPTDDDDLVDFAPPSRGAKAVADAGPDMAAPPGEVEGDLDVWCAWRPQNDLGNAERFFARFGADFRWVREIGWHAWDGARWNRADGARRAQLAAQDTVRAIYGEARAMKAQGHWTDGRVAGHMKHAQGAGSSGQIAALQREAAPFLTVEPEAMDADPFLLTAANGTLELGEVTRFREHRRADLISRAAAAAWDEETEAPAFSDFVAKILPDAEVRAFVQRWFGYCLTGDISEQVMVMLLGDGSNGKSTLLNAISRAVGDWHMGVPIQSVLRDDHKSGSGASPDIARLVGARMVTTSEPEVGHQYSESMIKQLTGGERMTARNMFKDFFEFTPALKLTVSANNKPRVRGQDDGIWRRILLVPFPRKVGPADVRPVYAALRGELPGILDWLVRGCEDWFQGGLRPPAQVVEEVASYRAESNPMIDFLREETERAAGETVQATRMYEAYKAWAAASAVEAWNLTQFGKRMREAGFPSDKVGSHKFYRGLRIRDDSFLEARRRDDSLAGDRDGDGAHR